MIETRRLLGESLGAALEDVARLRIAVFRTWPYLYDGDLAYEQEYLQTYRDSADRRADGGSCGGLWRGLCRAGGGAQ